MFISHIVIRDTHRTANFSWKNAFDRYFAIIPDSMYRLPAESHDLLHHLLISILFSTRNLISLAIQDINISLDESLVNDINNHPTLDRIMLESLCQLCWLPLDFYPRTSFARIHAQGLKLDRHQLLVPDDTLHALCHRPPDHESSESIPGPHVYELQVEAFPSSAWTGLTFDSLRKLTVRDADDAFATGGCGGFFDRHKGLEEIYLNGHGLRHESALRSIPCLTELYEKAVERGKGMEKGFYVDSVSLSRSGDSQSSTSTKLLGIGNGGYAPRWILKTISFTIVKDTARVLSFILENLPPCEDLYFQRRSDDAGLVVESTSITQVGLFFSRRDCCECHD